MMQPLTKWLRSIGRTPETGIYWEKTGRITVSRFYGRKYISDEEVAKFLREGADTKIANVGQFGFRKN